MQHPYEKLSLFTMGIILAIWLIGLHATMLLKATPSQEFLKKFPRNPIAGQILMTIGMVWFWLLVAPDGLGFFSKLQMDFGEFNQAKPLLRIATPVVLVLVVMSIRDFLAVRGLGLVGLMAASPLLESAFLKDPDSRLLVPLYAYVMLTISLFCVGMPYLFRDAITWITANQSRWFAAATAGLLYGIAVLTCALLFWRNY